MTQLGRNVSEFDKAHLANNDVGGVGAQNHTDISVTWEVRQCLSRWRMRRQRDLYGTGRMHTRTGAGSSQTDDRPCSVALERTDAAIFSLIRRSVAQMHQKLVCSSMYNALQYHHWFQSVPLKKKKKIQCREELWKVFEGCRRCFLAEGS